MDRLAEHAIRMLEIIENERGFYKDSAKDIADIARVVYDIILRVQVNEVKAKTADTPQTETHDLHTETHECVSDTPQKETIEKIAKLQKLLGVEKYIEDWDIFIKMQSTVSTSDGENAKYSLDTNCSEKPNN